MITSDAIHDFMRRRNIQPKYPGVTRALQYTCVRRDWIPVFLALAKIQLAHEGFFKMNPKPGSSVCRQSVQCGLNYLSFLQRSDSEFSDPESSVAAMAFDYTPENQPGGATEGHEIIGFFVKRGGPSGGFDDLDIVWADMINGCKIIQLNEIETTFPAHWDIRS